MRGAKTKLSWDYFGAAVYQEKGVHVCISKISY